MAVCDASTLIVSGTYNAAAFGTVVGYTWRYERRFVTIRDEGSVNPNCRGTIEKDLICTVRFLSSAPVADTDTAAALVFTTSQADGSGTTTETLNNMIPMSASRRADRDSPPFEFEQDFVCKGAAALPTVSIG